MHKAYCSWSLRVSGADRSSFIEDAIQANELTSVSTNCVKEKNYMTEFIYDSVESF